MNSPRLVLVTRRYWPLVGGAEIMMSRLAAAFLASGAPTTVVTARWQPDWPEQIDRQGVRVIRLAQPPQRFWGTWKYMRALSSWLAARRSDFDLVYVSMLKHDAYAALSAARRGRFPVVLRAEGSGLTGDCHWQLEARFGRRIKRRCRQAAAIVAPSPAIERELIAAGYARDRIVYLPNGVPLPPDGATNGADSVRDRAARANEARAVLCEGNSALQLPEGGSLAVYTGRLHANKGLEYLVEAWKTIDGRYPRARLWIVGEGESRAALVQLIENLGMSGRVVLAGAYDDVEDFLDAADVFVLPSLEEGMSLALLEAMARGVPVVATDIAANRVLVTDGVHGRLVPPERSEALAAAIAAALADREASSRMADAACARVAESYSLAKLVDAHLALFRRLLEQG